MGNFWNKLFPKDKTQGVEKPIVVNELVKTPINTTVTEPLAISPKSLFQEVRETLDKIEKGKVSVKKTSKITKNPKASFKAGVQTASYNIGLNTNAENESQIEETTEIIVEKK